MRYYSVRRLSPYRGTIQIVELPGFRALSADGETWRVQVLGRGARFSSQGVWRPDGGGSLIETERTRACIEALRARPQLPFPLADSLELWLLDARAGRPLALLASTLPEHSPPPIAEIGWRTAFAADDDFVAPSLDPHAPRATAPPPIPHREVLARCIQKEVGPRPRAQWFRRLSDGSGIGLAGCRLEPGWSGRRLAPEAFPELLLREQWETEREVKLVRDYHDWLSPWLLTHSRLRRATRDRLERAACRYPERLYAVRQLLPEIINHDLVKVALVEACLRRSVLPAAS